MSGALPGGDLGTEYVAITAAIREMNRQREENAKTAAANVRLRELAANERESAESKARSDAKGLGILRGELREKLADYAQNERAAIEETKKAQQSSLGAERRTRK